jgi:hypothetical protein
VLLATIGSFNAASSTTPNHCHDVLALVAWALGASTTIDSVAPSRVLESSSNENVEPWLAASLDVPGAQQWVIVRNVLRGQHVVAQRLLEKVAQPERDALDHALRIRMGLRPQTLRAFESVAGCSRDINVTSALSLAEQGDGAALATALEHCRAIDVPPSHILSLLPGVREHRATLGAAARHAFGQRVRMPTDIPFTVVTELAFLRDLQALAGESDSATQLDQMIARHFGAFQSREQVFALLAWRTVGDSSCTLH